MRENFRHSTKVNNASTTSIVVSDPSGSAFNVLHLFNIERKREMLGFNLMEIKERHVVNQISVYIFVISNPNFYLCAMIDHKTM